MNSRAVRVGSPSERRSAASPVRTSPSARRTTIDGMVAARSPSWKISTRSPTRRRGRRVGRPEIDPERVRHRTSPRSLAAEPRVYALPPPGRYAEGTLGADDDRARHAARRRARRRPAPSPIAAPDPTEVAALVAEAVALADARGRDDLAERLRAIADRVARTDTVVCVVGEFKKGKSALINALIGADVCPVDDDLATMAVTVVRHATEPGAVVRRREAGELIVEAIPADEAGRWVAERDGDARRRRRRARRGRPAERRSSGAASRWSTRPASAASTRPTPPRPWPSCRRPTRSSS